jgi:hypothetical protein
VANSPPRRLTCYISMPFGRKQLPDGLELDFDRIYREGICPALELAGVTPVRADALVTRGSIQKATLEAILHSDFMVADITGANPNVLYELGIRHALVPHATLVVASTDASTPLDLHQLRVVRYETSDTKLGNGKAFVEELRQLVEQRIQRPSVVDSPVFEYIPDLQVGLRRSREKYFQEPPALEDSFRQRLVEARRLRPADALPKLLSIEREAAERQALTGSLAKDLLLAYRDAALWQEVVRLYDQLPLQTQKDVFFTQQAAMALNRRNLPGDRPRAIAMLQDLLANQGSSAETCGILGRIYKDDFAKTHDKLDLERAIAAYRQGVLAEPDDYYVGVNLINLLSLKDDADARREVMERLPPLRATLRKKLANGPVDYWEVATLFELAVLARDWSDARSLAAEARVRAPASWMLESTALNVRRLADRLTDPADRARLQSILAEFGAVAAAGEPA